MCKPKGLPYVVPAKIFMPKSSKCFSEDTKEALPLLDQAYQIFKKTLGGDHPNTKQLEKNLEYLRNVR